MSAYYHQKFYIVTYVRSYLWRISLTQDIEGDDEDAFEASDDSDEMLLARFDSHQELCRLLGYYFGFAWLGSLFRPFGQLVGSEYARRRFVGDLVSIRFNGLVSSSFSSSSSSSSSRGWARSSLMGVSR